MRLRTIEISVGAFMLAGILAAVFIAVRISGINFGADEKSYLLSARFDDVAGLKQRAKVTMAGVSIGQVVSIDVDSIYGEAIVTIRIRGDVQHLAIDTSARILTEGLIGGRYVGLIAGAEEEYLKDGDSIVDTQGALVLETLIGEFVTRQGG